MSTEREMKLIVSPEFRLPRFEGLPDGVTAAPRPVERLQTVYLDTADLRLARWGVSLRHHTGEGWTVKLPGERVGPLLVRGEYLFPGEAKDPPAEALDLLRAYVRTSTLRTAARLRSARRGVDVRDGDDTVLAAVVYDEVSVLVGGRVEHRFREVEVEEFDGSTPEILESLLSSLHATGAVTTGGPVSKYQRAIGDRAARPPEVTVSAPSRGVSAGEAVRRAISSSVVDLIRSDAAVRIDEDPEGVHQARVSTRRLRSDLRTFGPLLDEDWTVALREALRWLGDALGDARDADVLLDRLLRRSVRLPPDLATGAEQVARALRRHDEEVHAALMGVYRSDRYVALLDRLVVAANEPALAPEADLPAAEILPGLVRRPWRRLERDVRRAGKRPTDEQLHAIRISTKRVRYAAEAVAPVAGKKARRFARAAAKLQGILGEYNDAIVAEAWLRGWAAGAGSRDAAFAAGVLAGVEQAAAADARGPWRQAWRTLEGRKPESW